MSVSSDINLTPLTNQQKFDFIADALGPGGTQTPHGKGLLELVGAVYDGWFEGGESMPDGLPLKDYIAKRDDAIDRALAGIAASVAALSAAVSHLTVAPGTPLDLAAVQDAAAKGAASVVANLRIVSA